MRYLRPDDLDVVRQLAAGAMRRRRPRRANRPRLYAPWPPLGTVDMAVLHAVRAGLERLAVTA